MFSINMWQFYCKFYKWSFNVCARKQFHITRIRICIGSVCVHLFLGSSFFRYMRFFSSTHSGNNKFISLNMCQFVQSFFTLQFGTFPWERKKNLWFNYFDHFWFNCSSPLFRIGHHSFSGRKSKFSNCKSFLFIFFFHFEPSQIDRCNRQTDLMRKRNQTKPEREWEKNWSENSHVNTTNIRMLLRELFEFQNANTYRVE